MMECLQIDWKNIDDTFEKDEFYENIQAPKWIDFTIPLQPVDDHAWFCGKTGCTHKSKTILQVLNQKSVVPFEASMMSANRVDPLAIKALSAGVAAKKARAVVSSSLSSLSDIKAAYAKNKVLHHMQMPPIGESKGETAKNNRRQQASENENPNRACRIQDGACIKTMPIALKMSESKGIVGKEAAVHAPNRGASIRITKTGGSTLSEHISLSQTAPVLEASKSVFIFGKRDPLHGKSTLKNGVDKEPSSDLSNITEAKSKKAGGTRFSSRLPPTARNPYLSASLAMPLVRKSAANARPLHGVYLGNDKVAECKPPRVTRDVRVSVPWRKRNDQKKESIPLEEGKLQERDQKDQLQTTVLSKQQEPSPPMLVTGDELEIGSKETIALTNTATREKQHTQRDSKGGGSICDPGSSASPMVQDNGNLSVEKNELLSLSICVEDRQGTVEESIANNITEESKSSDIQRREKEDSITNTLEKFLENLRITSHEDELVLNEENCEFKQKLVLGDCVTEQNLSDVVSVKEQEIIVTDHVACALEQDAMQTRHVDNKHEALVSKHVNCAAQGVLVQSHSEDNALEHEMVISCCKDNALENAARCSHQSDELSQMCKPLLYSKDERNLTSAALHMRTNSGISAKDEVISIENDKGLKKFDKKQDFQFTKDWQRHRGTKRKSSELNLNCSGKDHKQETQKLKLPIIPASQPHGRQESCEEQHKKMKTTTQAFKPFRFRTEERGALKELGLGKKELGIPNSKEPVHHALRMPSFGRPFIPQRSTKKLTIPREPKFHVSRNKNTCTSLATSTGIASS